MELFLYIIDHVVFVQKRFEKKETHFEIQNININELKAKDVKKRKIEINLIFDVVVVVVVNKLTKCLIL